MIHKVDMREIIRNKNPKEITQVYVTVMTLFCFVLFCNNANNNVYNYSRKYL